MSSRKGRKARERRRTLRAAGRRQAALVARMAHAEGRCESLERRLTQIAMALGHRPCQLLRLEIERWYMEGDWVRQEVRAVRFSWDGTTVWQSKRDLHVRGDVHKDSARYALDTGARDYLRCKLVDAGKSVGAALIEELIDAHGRAARGGAG
jgi:hypothetical protein